MAFFLKGISLSQLRLQPQIGDSSVLMRRRLHVEPGAREKALLAADPALRHFKSHTKSVARLKRAGDVLTAIVVAGCCYEIYVRAMMPKEQARSVP